jgi:endonuclease YncB( thermonuclease family)
MKIRHILGAAALSLTAGAALAGPDPVPAGKYELHGKVVTVADGDTITLLIGERKQRRIRLDSIDAPEEGHGAAQPGQPYAEAARRHLSDLVAGKTLTARCYLADQYGRDVCALMLEDGSSANRAQVAAGYAWAYTARHGEYLRDKSMTQLQREARGDKLGLWARKDASEPWKWRYDCWRQKRCER